jgi:7-cyano-7-deazaguanine synthase in queuosine biosynthesis
MVVIKKQINILWTGGMDSTFRLIKLIIIFKKVVQPYYIIDVRRKSTIFELKAMDEIRKELISKYPYTEQQLLQTKMCLLEEIPHDEEINSSYTRLAKIESIGIQYEWLSRFCKYKKINEMELSLETAIYDKDNRTRKLLGKDLKELVSDTGVSYKLSDDAKGKDKYNIYGRFTFPAFDLTKSQKYKYSIENNFDEIIRLTWFCHTPTKKSKPCGKCHPCMAVYREGLAWRLPFCSKIRFRIWPMLRAIKRFINQNVKYILE